MLYISSESFLEHPFHNSIVSVLQKHRHDHPNGPDIYIELPFFRNSRRSVHHLDKSLLFVVGYSPKMKRFFYGLGRLYNKHHVFQYPDNSYTYDPLSVKDIYHCYNRYSFTVEDGGRNEVSHDTLQFAPFNSYSIQTGRSKKIHDNEFESAYFNMLYRLHSTFSDTFYTTGELLEAFRITHVSNLKQILPAPRLFL